MKKRQIPHTFVIIGAIILFAAALTWVVPAGKYVKSTAEDGTALMTYTPTQAAPQTWQIFTSLYDGFVDKADIIIFILVIGGAFWIVNASHAVDYGIRSFLRHTRRWERNRVLARLGVNNLILTAIMLVFSLFGAVFGMSEETIAFTVILVPMAISMGYDSITGLCMAYVAAALGFAGALLNPFTIGIAQGLAGLPLFSGIEYRLFCWVVINLVGFAYILRYARKVHRNPQASPVYDDDHYWRTLQNEQSQECDTQGTSRAAWWNLIAVTAVLLAFSCFYPLTDIKIGNRVLGGIPALPVLTGVFVLTSWVALRRSALYYVLNLLFFTIFFLIVGVMGYGWYIGEISGLFMGLAVAAGWASGYDANRITRLFTEGCKDIFSAAFVVGLAGGIIAILQNGSIIDTILHSMSQGMQGMGQVATVEIMYGIQNAINLFIPSGSAKAALTMPIMADFSDLIGLSKQATVMAFQFGDGFTNLITPTSGVLIAALGVARVPYDKWFRWVWRLILILVAVGALLLIPTVLLRLNGF